jgi:uncharacterized protein (TIGR02996 family)
VNQHEAFLEAITERPSDDAPRLIYADWLEDNDDGKSAELIRVQIERARLDKDDDRQAELQSRERRLLMTHARALPWMPKEVSPAWVRFRRGFPDWFAHSDQWLLQMLEHVQRLPIERLEIE